MMPSPTRAVDRPHGLLPAWGNAALPAPPPFTMRNALRTVVKAAAVREDRRVLVDIVD